jgi:hypothetical protein
MCVNYVLASPRIAQVDPGDGPPPKVVLSQMKTLNVWTQPVMDEESGEERRNELKWAWN